MDTAELIQFWEEFIKYHYEAILLENARKGDKFLHIDFLLLCSSNVQASEHLLETPSDDIKCIQMAIEKFDLPGGSKDFEPRIFNLPKTQKLRIRDIRAEHLEKLYIFTGTVRQKSDVRPKAVTSRFECPACGNTLTVLQLDSKFREPTRCGCGRKGKFRLLSKELVDAQGLYLEESTDDLEGNEQPKRLKVFLKKDLVSPMSDKRTNPGTKINVVGVIKEVPIQLRSGGQSTDFDLIMEAIHVEPLEDDSADVTISHEEEAELRALAQDKDIILKLRKDLAPSIYGHDTIKEALMLQMVGGVPKIKKDGSKTRGDMHILLVGDPGCGKSQLLKRISHIAPRSRFVSGKGASGAGLTATVVKDDFVGGWAVEAGLLVLAHRGLACIDELDKMGSDDTDAMHEALEGQTVTISKASVQATLKCETTVLAAANPKLGRFDPYAKTITEQINLPITLINRFDLIIPVKDEIKKERDEALAEFILDSDENDHPEPELSTETLRKYFTLAKSIEPTIPKDIRMLLVEHYVSMRHSAKDGTKNFSISPRQLNGLARMAKAYAKLRFSETVSEDDFERAKYLMDFYLRQIALDPETGTIDFDRIQTGIGNKERERYQLILEEIRKAKSNALNNFMISHDDLLEKAKEFDISEDKLGSILSSLKKKGEIYEPKRNFWKLA